MAAAAGAPSLKKSAVCLLTGDSEHASPLVVNHSPSQTHMHTVQLRPDADGAKLKSIFTSPETLAHMYGCAPGGLDLLGFNGVKVHGATTTHMGPVGITFSSKDSTTGEFVPLKTLTRSCYQSQTHGALGGDDAGQLCHFIANPASVGFVHPPAEMKLHESQCADDMATNLCLRQMRWPDMKMTPSEGYMTVHSDTHGEMSAIPMTSPAKCNVSHLLVTNESDIHKIAGPSAKVVESTGGKFAMIQTSALNSIKEKLAASFKTKSLFNGGLTCNMFPLDGTPMSKDCVTTLTYSLMKDPRTITERTATAMDMSPGDTTASAMESIHHAHIPSLLGEADATSAVMVGTAEPTVTELSAELASLMNA